LVAAQAGRSPKQAPRRKVMTAYPRVYGFSHLRATCEDRDQLRNLRSFRIWDYLYILPLRKLSLNSLIGTIHSQDTKSRRTRGLYWAWTSIRDGHAVFWRQSFSFDLEPRSHAWSFLAISQPFCSDYFEKQFHPWFQRLFLRRTGRMKWISGTQKLFRVWGSPIWDSWYPVGRDKNLESFTTLSI